MVDEWHTLPNGVKVVTRVTYTPMQSGGPLALAVTASVSLCAVTSILIAMAISGFKTRHQFIRSQVGAYFLSLVLSDLLQAAGSVMNAKWVAIQGVSTGNFCTVQAALKQSGNVGTALWSLVIAIQTFCLLFLRLRIGDYVFYAILVGVWLFIIFIVMMGPVILQNSANGPYWGISGYWCWITDGYHVEQLTEEYLFMFLTAGTSFVLYSLIFFRLRGNIQGFGWGVTFRRVKQPWVEDDADESQMSTAGKQMLWYPVAYIIIIFPISVCRWSAIFGHKVPYWATMTADSIFMLSGFVNAILYSTTRKIVSIRAAFSFSHLIRITPSRRNLEWETATPKAYLDSMEFATPVSPSDDKCCTCQSSITAATHHPLWDTRSGGTLADCTREEPLPSPGLWNIDNLIVVGEHYPPGTSSGMAGNQGGLDPAMTDPSILVALPSVNGAQSSDLHGDSRLTLSRKLSQDRTMGEMHIASTASESSLTTDGAPPSHHKRFSGWSLPTVQGGRLSRHSSLDGQDSPHTELDEMQFAPPSPEPARKKVPSPSRQPSCFDLQSSEPRSQSHPD